jgi:hypothetical protein
MLSLAVEAQARVRGPQLTCNLLSENFDQILATVCVPQALLSLPQARDFFRLFLRISHDCTPLFGP